MTAPIHFFVCIDIGEWGHSSECVHMNASLLECVRTSACLLLVQPHSLCHHVHTCAHMCILCADAVDVYTARCLCACLQGRCLPMYLCKHAQMSTRLHVYMCICVYVYLCICVSVYMCICVHVYVCICVHVYVCICVQVYVCICVHVYVWRCVHIQICMCVGGNVSVCKCLHRCMSTCASTCVPICV